MMLVGFWACKDRPEYPTAPQISKPALQELNEGGGIDRKLRLSFDYTDGDGDLGLTEDDRLLAPYQKWRHDSTANPYHYNIVIHIEKQKPDGSFTDLTPSPFALSGAFPPLAEPGYAGPVDGRFTYNITFSTFADVEAGDGVRVRFYIYDRALNKSNTLASPLIFLR